jgi:hypothetical protein
MAYLLIAVLIIGFIVFLVAGVVVLSARDQRGTKDKD